MALKEHLVDSTKLSEEQIETVVSGRVKFDPERKTIVLLPSARKLSTRSKILIYLTALKGWRFILPKDAPEDTAVPGTISKAIGAPGGSVRPILGTLVSSGVLRKEGSNYSVPPHIIPDIESEIGAEGVADSGGEQPGGKTRMTRPRRGTSRKGTSVEKAAGKTAKKTADKPRRGGSAKPSASAKFQELLDDGWFKGGRTTKELKEKLHEMTVFVPITQLPKILIRAYRQGKLTRKKEEEGGKNVWVYRQK